MKSYLSEAFAVNDLPKVSKKLRLSIIADPLTNLRLRDWLDRDAYEIVAKGESLSLSSVSNIQADIIVARIDESLRSRVEVVEKIARFCDRLLIIGSGRDEELIAAVVRYKIKGYICQQSKETFQSALAAIAVGGCYVEPEIYERLQIVKTEASQKKLLDWSYLLSIDLLSQWLNLPTNPIPIREIFLELGLLQTESSIFNELLAPAPNASIYEQLNEHLRHLKEVDKQTDSDFKIAVVCQEIDNWIFNSFHHQIRIKVKELKYRKVKILEEILTPFANGGTQRLLDYYRGFLKQIAQIRDDYSLNERESAAVENASYEAYCKLKVNGQAKIDALCLSYRKKIEAQLWRSSIEVIEEIIQLLESYIKQLSLTKNLMVNTTKILMRQLSGSFPEKWLLKDDLNQFKSNQELLVSFEEQLGVPLNAWGEYITLGELYNSMKTFIFPMVEELYQQGIKQAFLK
jgi:hypothetical protein